MVVLVQQTEPGGGSTGYVYIARRLAFDGAQPRVREHVIAEPNSLLTRSATGCAVGVTGNPTARESEGALRRMLPGSGFKEALKRANI